MFGLRFENAVKSLKYVKNANLFSTMYALMFKKVLFLCEKMLLNYGTHTIDMKISLCWSKL